MEEVSVLSVYVRRVDLNSNDDADRVLLLLNAYACDPMGAGKPLTKRSEENVIDGLRSFPTTRIYLAFLNNDAKVAVGLAICFTGFSTFNAKPLLNIHDFIVLPEYRLHKVATCMLQFIESDCRHEGYCKITLEVLSNNVSAKRCYESFGFEELTDDAGQALFWQKKIV